jgi:SNF2 family DNA or RNA helicase
MTLCIEFILIYGMTLLLMLPSHNNGTVQIQKEVIRLLLFALNMLSGNLIKLYDDVKIPSLIRYKLEKIYRITTIDDLIIEREEISYLANDSSDVLMLVGIACYFNERRKTEGMNVQLCPLISKSTQFVSYMAKFAISNGIMEDDEKHSTDKHKLQMDDELRKDLKIDSNDTPWRLNSSQTLKYVELKKLPREIRLPVPLFKKLFMHQRSGIEWMADLFIAKTGGVIGDEMGMGKTVQSLSFIFSLLDSRTIRNVLVVCPNPILLTTWRSEATKLLDYFGSNCAIQVDVITSEIGKDERNKILKGAKNW